MAKLATASANNLTYLKPYHRFGRMKDSVDTLIEHPEMSRVHAIIEWSDECWNIRDVSKNGVWLNQQRISPNKPFRLHLNDIICFAGIKEKLLKVVDLAKPQDVLRPVCECAIKLAGKDQALFLRDYQFLPCEDEPEIVMVFDAKENQWQCEQLAEQSVFEVADNDYIRFAGSIWRLEQYRCEESSETVLQDPQTQEDIQYVFNISQDEEFTELKLFLGNRVIDLNIRCHHYLTALLVRYKEKMKSSTIDSAIAGWVSVANLSRDLGLSESHINIQVHRARKQLVETFEKLGLAAPDLIERKKGHIRFVSDNYKVMKGDRLELSADLAW